MGQDNLTIDGLDASYTMQAGSLHNDQITFNPRHWSVLDKGTELDQSMREKSWEERRKYFGKTFRIVTGNYRIAQPDDNYLLNLIDICGDAIPIRWAIWKIVTQYGVQTAVPPTPEADFPPGGAMAGWFNTHHLVADLSKKYKRLLKKFPILTVQRAMTKLVQFGTLERYIYEKGREPSKRGWYRLKLDTDTLTQDDTIDDLLGGSMTRCRPVKERMKHKYDFFAAQAQQLAEDGDIPMALQVKVEPEEDFPQPRTPPPTPPAPPNAGTAAPPPLAEMLQPTTGPAGWGDAADLAPPLKRSRTGKMAK